MPNPAPARTITLGQIDTFLRAVLNAMDVNDAAAAVGVEPADLMLAMLEGEPGNALLLRYTNAMYNRIELDQLCRARRGTPARSKEAAAAGGHIIFDDAQALRLLSAHRARQEKRAAEVAKMAGAASVNGPEPLPPVSADALFAFMKDRISAAEAARTAPAAPTAKAQYGSRGGSEMVKNLPVTGRWQSVGLTEGLERKAADPSSAPRSPSP